jgi:integrase
LKKIRRQADDALGQYFPPAYNVQRINLSFAGNRKEVFMKKLVTLWRRPSREEGRFTYSLIYYDEEGRRRQKSLGHADARKAERQRAKLEQDLRMGLTQPDSMNLERFLADSMSKGRSQVRESTMTDYKMTLEDFIKVIGNIDIHRVRHEHGEKFLCACLDKGNTPATAAKKLRELKSLFQRAVERGLLEANPFRYIRQPKVAKTKIRVLTNDECGRLLNVAQSFTRSQPVRWDLLILSALCTGLRRGELMNLTWQDIDLERKIVQVSPKPDTVSTWKWQIKDTDRRVLPLTDELLGLFREHKLARKEGYPYVFVPPSRCDEIQKLRKEKRWPVHQANSPINGFDCHFGQIRKLAKLDDVTFHDLRRTCLSQWFVYGLREFDVMTMAGHSSFSTTRNFYLAVRQDLLESTRQASEESLKSISVAKLLHSTSEDDDGLKKCS